MEIISRLNLERFKPTYNEEPLLAYAGTHITDNEDIFHIDQDLYMSKIVKISGDAEFGMFASMKMKFAWLKNTKPDLALEISQIEQVTLVMFDKHVTKHC